MIVAAIVTFVLGAILHYPELGVLAAGAAAMILIGVVWVLRRPVLSVQRTVEPGRVERDGTALGLLRVTNRGRFSASPMTAYDRCGAETRAVLLPKLSPDASHRSSYELPTSRRGIVDIGPLSVALEDPAGCWRRDQRTGTIERLVVHPKVHSLRTLPAGSARSLDGAEIDRSQRGSATFHSLREYVRGDDLRHIHWRSSARVGVLMMREHVDQSLPEVVIALDTSVTAYPEEGFEEAVEIAGSIALAATNGRFPVRLLTSDGRLERSRGLSSDANNLLDLLAEVKQGDGNLSAVVPHLSSMHNGDLLVVVTGHIGADQVIQMDRVGRRFRRSMVVLVGPTDSTSASFGTHVHTIRAASGAAFAVSWNGLRW